MQKNETERPPPLAEVALGYGWTDAAEQGVSVIRSHVEERCRGETHATSTRAKRYGKSGVAIPVQRGGNRDGVLSTAGSKERAAPLNVKPMRAASAQSFSNDSLDWDETLPSLGLGAWDPLLPIFLQQLGCDGFMP